MDGTEAKQAARDGVVLRGWPLFGRLALAVASGCLLYVLAFALRAQPSLRLLTEQAGDARQQLRADYETPKPGAPPILFLDVNHETYAAVGRPPITPRTLLAAMLERAAEGRPALILLDLDPTWPGDEAGSRTFAATLARLGRGPTPILLSRAPMAPAHPGLPTYFRPSPELDAIVAESPALMWVSAGAIASGDGVVRRAPLWFSGCVGETPTVLPSAALAGWMILKDGAAEAKERLAGALEGARRLCSVGASLKSQPPAALEVSIGGRAFKLMNDWPDDSFAYAMAAALEPGQRRQSVAKPDGSAVDVLEVVSAKPFVDNPQEVAADLFRGRVTIIGASAPDLGDLHATPLGEMPGALVVANQLRGLLEQGPGDGRGFFFGLGLTALLSVATFAAWLPFRLLAPNAWPIVEQAYSVAVGALIWGLAAFLARGGAALLFPLIQYFVMLILFSLKIEKNPASWGVKLKQGK